MFSYSHWLDELLKAAGHKYIKRVPYQSGGKMRYRYIYNATHTHGGKHVLDPDHMKVGTKLMLDATSGAEVHGHIQSVSGDKVTFVYDDGPKKGESVTMSKEKLASELDKVHGISSKLDAARKKQSDVVAKLKESGASAKQIARAEARLKALGGDTPKAKPTKAKPTKATAKSNGDPTETKVQAALKKLADPKIKEVFDQITEGERFDAFDSFDEGKLRLLKELDVPVKVVSLDVHDEPQRVTRLVGYENDDFALVHVDGDLVLVGLTGEIKGKTQIVINNIGGRSRMIAVLAEAQRRGDIQAVFSTFKYESKESKEAYKEMHQVLIDADTDQAKVDENYRLHKEARMMSKFVDIAEELAKGPVDGGKDAPAQYERQSPQVYESLDEVPKKLRAQLESYVSRDEVRVNINKVIRDDGMFAATDGRGIMSIRSTALDAPAYTVDKQGNRGMTSASVVSFLTEASEFPQAATISNEQVKQIQRRLAKIGKASTEPIVISTLEDGRTTISYKGVKIADLPAHNTHTPIKVSVSELSRALSIGEAVTIGVGRIQNMPALNIESLSAQQLVLGLRD